MPTVHTGITASVDHYCVSSIQHCRGAMAEGRSCLWLCVPEISCGVMDVHCNTTRKLCAKFLQHSPWLTDLHLHKQCQCRRCSAL